METETVSAIVPANLMRLLREKGYFEKGKDEWFTSCVRQGVDVELNKLKDQSEIRRLEDKYGLGVEFFSEDPAFEVPLTPEQYATMRAWLESKDFIEIFTGPGETKATVINSRLLWRKNHPDWNHDELGELVHLNITMNSPFLDFIREYLRFFGCKDNLETFCMKAIYEKVQSLNGDLTKFAGTHGLNTFDWLARFNERTHGPDPNEENDC